MIEKLQPINCGQYLEYPDREEVMNKINEIIEVVNSLSTDDDYVLPTPEEVKKALKDMSGINDVFKPLSKAKSLGTIKE
mgnify:CR=1 FL=1